MTFSLWDIARISRRWNPLISGAADTRIRLRGGDSVILYGLPIDRNELLWAIINLRPLTAREFASIYGWRAGWYFGKERRPKTQEAIVARVLNDQARLAIIRHAGTVVELLSDSH